MRIKKVMFVDDEKYILRSIKKLFEEEPYEIILLQSAKEAMVYLETSTVDLIVSDSRMPEIDGAEFLTWVRDNHSTICRVFLCDFNESRSIHKMINKNVAKQYLFKPWNDHEFLCNIRGLLDSKELMMNKSLLSLIDELTALPSLPRVYHDITTLIRNDADIGEVAKIVDMDQSISSQVLKLANSAFYGRKTGDITQAIMGIGLNNLKNIVLTTSLFKGPPKIMKEVEALWQHAVNTNVLTHMFYDYCLRKKMPSIYGSAGLLHDIGKLILHVYYQDVYQTLIEKGLEEERPLIDVELEEFLITHQDIGAYFLNSWELPFAYVEAAMFHHRPCDERIINSELVSVIHLANYYSMKILSNDDMVHYLDEDVFENLGLEREDIEAVVESLRSES